ncbi:MAG: tetratricopeptide repeat protein [Rhodobacteraceae bacterium]|nr:tetratricopeptide repeat protein [Paracoccaceae bacterium]
MWVDSLPATNDLRGLQRSLTAYQGTSGSTPGYHVALGTLFIRLQDLASAEQAFRRALELDPKYGKAHLGLGAVALLRKDRPRALGEFKMGAELAGPRSTDGLRYADLLVAGGDAAQARAWVEAITAKAPDFLPAQVRLAQIALAERRHDDCERLLKLVLARDPAYLDALMLMARLRQAQNDPARWSRSWRAPRSCSRV